MTPHDPAVPAIPFFPQARRVGDTVYVGLRTLPASDAGQPIEQQTHHVFQALISALESQGAAMSDLVKLHTYYPYDGDGRDVTDYWERMTAVRLQYLANPGPAATALRVSGMAPGGPLIGVDGIGDCSGKRSRIMPTHAWDWSMPTPFSQGWLVGNHVLVGGQISADRQGKAVDPNQLEAQVDNTLEFIRHVLRDGGAGWEHVTSIKVAYKCTGRNAESARVLADILSGMARVFPDNDHKPALVPFGVDLLYEGLLLEIDATAVKDVARLRLAPDSGDWAGKQQGYAAAIKAGDELHLGGQCAPGAGSLGDQAQACIAQIAQLLRQAGGTLAHLVKLNVYCVTDAPHGQADFQVIEKCLREHLQPGRTVLSLIAVPGLQSADALVQMDGLAVLVQN